MRRPHVDVSGGDLGMGPGHEVVDARCWPAIDELGQRVGEPRMRVHLVQLQVSISEAMIAQLAPLGHVNVGFRRRTAMRCGSRDVCV